MSVELPAHASGAAGMSRKVTCGLPGAGVCAFVAGCGPRCDEAQDVGIGDLA
jgi:hypothetical protein